MTTQEATQRVRKLVSMQGVAGLFGTLQLLVPNGGNPLRGTLARLRKLRTLKSARQRNNNFRATKKFSETKKILRK